MKVFRPISEPLPPNFESIFRSPPWVRVFNFIMGSRLTPHELEDLVRTHMQQKEKETLSTQLSFEGL